MTTLHPDWFDWPEIQTLSKIFADHKQALRFVGGCVRDSIIGRRVSDIDMATRLMPEQVMELAEAAGVKVVPTGLQHGTVTVVINKKHIEITTLRKDTACDGRHAEVEFTDDWQEDAQRRDFTMNALFLSFDGELFDYTGGVADATGGRVRFIGDASLRIKEDYLRILRFFRFVASHGKTPADEAALAACREHKEGLQQLSGERIQTEMLKLLAVEDPIPALHLMEDTGVLAERVQSSDIQRLERLLVIGAKTQTPPVLLETKLAALFVMDCVDDVSQRWKLSKAMRNDVMNLHRWSEHMVSETTDAQQKKILRQCGRKMFEQLVLFVWSSIGGDENHYQSMLQLVTTWDIPEFPVSGVDLKAQGFSEGKELGDKLAELEARWEASDYTLSKEELLALAL